MKEETRSFQRCVNGTGRPDGSRRGRSEQVTSGLRPEAWVEASAGRHDKGRGWERGSCAGRCREPRTGGAARAEWVQEVWYRVTLEKGHRPVTERSLDSSGCEKGSGLRVSGREVTGAHVFCKY